MTVISYAQECEDVILQRAFPVGHVGFYIDAGASDPVFDSVTKHFSNHGWRGVNVEPLPGMYERLCADRPRDVNLNVGLSDREGRRAFYEVPEQDSWSTFSPEAAAHRQALGLNVREREVPVTTLSQVCERHVDGPIDFLKIDVEGFEREVIAGADWSRWRPRVVVVENSWPQAWEPLLLAAGYLLARVSEINRFYVRDEDRELVPVLARPFGRDDDYLLIHHVQVLRSVYAEITRDGLDPVTLRTACRLSRAASRHPRLASACRRVFRRAV